MTNNLISHPKRADEAAPEIKTATAVGDFPAYKRRAPEDGGRRDGMETASLISEAKLSPEIEEEISRAMRRYERRERRERFADSEKFDRFTGSYMTLGEEFGQ